MTASETTVIAVFVGVPTPPKGTGTELNIRAIVVAASGSNPTEAINGPASAAGVPNPAAPSIKAPNRNPMITA